MIKVKKWLIVACLMGFSLGGVGYTLIGKNFGKTNRKVYSVLESLHQNERRDLEAFLKFLFLKEGFAFVSLGEIPCSFTEFVDLKNCSQDVIYILKNVRSEDYVDDTYSEQVNVNRGWIAWQKIQDECNQKDLVLKQVKDDDNYIYLMIINKRNFKKTYDLYKPYFDRELDLKRDKEQILADFCDHQYPFTEVLNDSRILRGILLGFGVHNTELYDKLRKTSIQLEMLKAVGETDTEEFRQLAEEEKSLNAKLTTVSWSKDYSEKKIGTRKFKAETSHEETKALQEQYLSDLEKIKSVYKDKDFLEATLEQFFY